MKNIYNPHLDAAQGAKICRDHLQAYINRSDPYSLDRAFIASYYMRNTLIWREKFKALIKSQSKTDAKALMTELESELDLLSFQYWEHERIKK